MQPETIPRSVKVLYYKIWTFENGNASAGIEVGRRDTNDLTYWPSVYAWEWLANIISFHIQIGPGDFMFRFHTPSEWRCWALLVRDTLD